MSVSVLLRDCHVAYAPRNDAVEWRKAKPMSVSLLLRDCHVAYAPRNDAVEWRKAKPMSVSVLLRDCHVVTLFLLAMTRLNEV